jgi:hypothetical protein
MFVNQRTLIGREALGYYQERKDEQRASRCRNKLKDGDKRKRERDEIRDTNDAPA